jgi:hypothetical protein
MTHGFSIKAPGTNAPQYFDLSGSWGKLVYTDDNDRQIDIDPCVAISSSCHKILIVIDNQSSCYGFDTKEQCKTAVSSIGL